MGLVKNGELANIMGEGEGALLKIVNGVRKGYSNKGVRGAKDSTF